MFALGFNSKQTLTLTFYLSELEIILGQIPSSNLETFQFPFKQKQWHKKELNSQHSHAKADILTYSHHGS